VEFVEHISADRLEACAMQTLPDSETWPLEEHLLICQSCLDRLQADIDFVTAMRGAATKIREQEQKEGH
jgi:hypothetical protein